MEEKKKEYKVDYGKFTVVLDFPEELAGVENYKESFYKLVMESGELDQFKEYFEALKDAYRRAANGETDVLPPRMEINVIVNYPYAPLRKNLDARFMFQGKDLGACIDRFAKHLDPELVNTFYDAYEGTDEKGNPKTFYSPKPSLDVGLSAEFTITRKKLLEYMGVYSETEFLKTYVGEMFASRIKPEVMIASLIARIDQPYQELAKPTNKLTSASSLKTYLVLIKRMFC